MKNILKRWHIDDKIIYILVGLILFILTYFILQHNKKIDIDNYLSQKTTQYTQNYNTIYKSYKRLSEILFKLNINTPKVQALFAKRDRDGLYNHLLNRYKILRQYKLKQLHFHLPNNHSFLRFHKPDRYGDDLTNIRQTVRYVNKERIPIDGFEEGRFRNGYRFVFPMYYKDRYIGSVEISFSTLAFVAEFSKMHNIPCNILIKKNIANKKVFKGEKIGKYINSPFANFYKEAKTTQYIGKNFHALINIGVSQHTKKLINSIEKQSDSFSVYDAVIDRVLTFIKVKNPITKDSVGLFIAGSDASFIHKQNLIFKIALTTLFFGIATILFFLYRDNQYKNYLNNLNKTLEKRVKIEVDKNRKKDKAILQQSRLAQMGEMLSMIAHQWRQPLAAISSVSTNIILKAKLNKLDNKSSIELANKIAQYTQHLSSTIDDFREFFKPNKGKRETTYDEVISSVLNIAKISLTNNNIKLITNLQSKERFLTYPNELKQVILNLIKNAEDILLERGIEDPTITIETKENILRVKDNAKGVPKDIIEKIFDPYFSTKTKKDGTGLGLYMSKTIIEEHCKGKLRVYNDEFGAVFEVELPTDKKGI